MTKCIIACDPGVNGGFALMYPSGILDMVKAKDRFGFMKYLIKPHETQCIIERVDVRPKDFTSIRELIFSAGECYERMASVTDEYVREVPPQTWMAALGVPKLEKADRKAWIQSKMEAVYNQKIPLWASDAVAIGYTFKQGLLKV